ncbi:hypothetical protein KAJ87_00190 [Candidatus Pacearchaeota archaeon]|nr:hypothetical protein [Candidatus Pacearchaeota archaeon]
MKKRVLGLFMILVLILFLGIASAETCYVDTKENCLNNGDHVVLGLSASTNAHGELHDEGNYNYALCCDFGNGVQLNECSLTDHAIYGAGISSNKLIGLSSKTNAHAQRVQDITYDEDVCYNGLTCVDTEGNCAEEDYSVGILSLSGTTNAHIGAYQDYSRNICCNIISCRIGEVASCGDYNENECGFDPCGVASDDAKETYDIDCSSNSKACYCEWSEVDGCISGWREIFSDYCGNNEIGSGEKCDGTDMPFTDCSSGNIDDCTAGTLSCYAPGHENECTLNIESCTGCNPAGLCDGAEINLGETCDGTLLNSKTCADFNLNEGTGLACYATGTENECTFDTTGCAPLVDYPSTIGKCVSSKSTDDTCEDGLMSYTWTAEWEWDEGNEGTTDDPCKVNYVLYKDGKCYYDPDEASKKCVGGSKTVPCPAQIQMPFFDYYGIVVTIIVVAFIYVFFILKKKGKFKKLLGKKKKK